MAAGLSASQTDLKSRLDAIAPAQAAGGGGGRGGGFGGRGGGGGPSGPPTLSAVSQAMMNAAMAMQEAESAPTARQIAACEEIWRHLLPLSEYPSSTSILLSRRAPYSASPSRAQAFCVDITATFFTPAGLYVSRDVRYSLFVLRSFLVKELVKDPSNLPDAVTVSGAFVRRFRIHSTKLFTAIRNEVGAIDLRVVREGPVE